VGQARFQKLTESTEPFLCPTCTSENQQKAIEELRGNVQALTTEILELKAAMAGLQKLSNSTAADLPTETGGGGSGETTAKTVGVGKLPWNVVASKGPKKGKGKYPARNANTPHVPKDNRPGSSIPPCQLGNNDSSPQDTVPSTKVVLPGVRRIWGTMRACSVPTVTKSITHLTNLGGKLKVKRKYKTNDAGKTTRWWFVVHAQEGLLKQLEEQMTCCCTSQ